MKTEKGFTLIEILVAIMVMSVALVVVMELFSGGLRAGRASEDYTTGVMHAASVMDAMLIKENFHQDIYSGQFEDGCQWESAITKIEDTLVRIDVKVRWPSGNKQKELGLSALKVVSSNETEI